MFMKYSLHIAHCTTLDAYTLKYDALQCLTDTEPKERSKKQNNENESEII